LELETLHINATTETPEVHLVSDGGISRIEGKSLPENAFEFYEPVVIWVRNFTRRSDKPLRLELRFEYFNSSSGRYLFEILNILEQSRHRQSYQIFWLCDKDDELMIDKGEELKSLIDMSFEIKLLESQS
jgi:hypothetical protein